MNNSAPGIPLYQQITEVLRQRLESGVPGAGDRMPSELQLCAEFSVSRTTVRQALGRLKQEGILSSRRGAGTHRLNRPTPNKLVRSAGDPLHGALASHPRVVAIGQVAAPGPVAAFFGLDPAASVLRVIRVHELAEQPLSVVISYLQVAAGKAVTRRALRDASMHEILWQQLGIRQQRSVHAIKVARADAEVAQSLRVGLADPVLSIQSSVYASDDTPVRWTDNYFREGRYEYTAEMLWPDPSFTLAEPDVPRRPMRRPAAS